MSEWCGRACGDLGSESLPPSLEPAVTGPAFAELLQSTSRSLVPPTASYPKACDDRSGLLEGPCHVSKISKEIKVGKKTYLNSRIVRSDGAANTLSDGSETTPYNGFIVVSNYKFAKNPKPTETVTTID